MLERLRSLFRAPERKSLSNPTDEELRIFTGGFLPNAYAVSPADALKVPAVARAISVISEGVAGLDRRIVRRVDGLEVEAPEHFATRFLADHWNDWTSPFEGVRDLISAALTADVGGMCWVNRLNGEAREVVQYRQSLTVNVNTDNGEPTYQLSNRTIDAADVIHVRGSFSRCALSLACDAIGIARTMEDRAGKLFRNAARPGGWVGFPENVDLDEDAFKRMKASWEDAFGAPEGSGKTAILHSGGQFHDIGFKSVDQQFIELRTFQVVEIGRAFGIPPGKLFEMSRQTWSNMEQASKEWMLDTLEGWCRAVEAALTRALLTADDRKAGYRVVIDRDDMTRADLVSRATAINSLRASEVLSADEARDWLGMGPRPADRLADYRNPNINPDRPAPEGGA